MELNIKQRFVVVIIYAALILLIGNYLNAGWSFVFDTSNILNVVLVATALALVLSSYVTEPYFSKPIDVITRWVAIYLFVNGLVHKEQLIMFAWWNYLAYGFILSALLLIFLHGFPRFEYYQKGAVDIICKVSRPEIVFTALYFSIVVSYFKGNESAFPILIGFGFLLIINKPIHYIVIWIWKLYGYFINKRYLNVPLGQIIGHDSADLYKVEVGGDIISKLSQLRGKLVYLESAGSGILGIVINENTLLSKKWLNILSLRDKENNFISFDVGEYDLLRGQKTIYSKSNTVSLINKNVLSKEILTILSDNTIYNNFSNLVGFVWSGSTIKQIKFHTLIDRKFLEEKRFGEGTIVQTKIGNEDVLYQIIDAKINEENLEHKDSYGFTIGTAQKLGKYNIQQNELTTVRWLPDIYYPIFLLTPSEVTYNSDAFIGKLPNTDYGIPIKSLNELVTHNTAVLGILGIGKTRLTLELIKKLLVGTGVKIFCIDITNQYAGVIEKYLNPRVVQVEITQATRDELRANNPNGTLDNPESWGNERLYKTKLDEELTAFISSDKRILIINPDLHPVSKAGSNYKIQHKTDLTVAEKTRIISERIFMKALTAGETTDARFLIIYEEAHSLVPEWNSVANEGDKTATNGTAKVVLQGRKYGLGTMAITQRTANISKSLLNQCNTIFAMRVFDDTGKQFLENYIGTDYSNLLPTLEERHAIVIGKALKLKQPVIIELNHYDTVVINEN